MLRIVRGHPLLIVESAGGREGKGEEKEGVEKRKGKGKVKGKSKSKEEVGDNGRSRYIVAADLHIGFEHELAAKGIRMDSGYVQEMLDELLSVARDEHCNGMILLGDIKDGTRGMSKEEWSSIPSFLTELAKHMELYIVPGNHDSYLRRVVPASARLMSSKGMLLGDTLLIHGHARPGVEITAVKRIVMAHLHPTLVSRDSVLNDERVWVMLKVEVSGNNILDVVIMPTFNRYITMLHSSRKYGNTSNDIIQLLRRLISKDLTIMKAVILTLDGSVVGDENTLTYTSM